MFKQGTHHIYSKFKITAYVIENKRLDAKEDKIIAILMIQHSSELSVLKVLLVVHTRSYL